MSRDTLIGPRIRLAWQPGETREERGERLYAYFRERVQATPRIERAYDRGDSDAYYGIRNSTPCIWDDGIGRVVIPEEDMTPEEIEAYWRGYHQNPSDRKDW